MGIRFLGGETLKGLGRFLGFGLTMLLGFLLGFQPGSGEAASKTQEIQVTIKQNAFDPAELTAKAGEAITLVVTNVDKTAEEFESRDLKVEKVIPAGKTVRISIRPLKPGAYEFFGEHHPQTAKGRLVVK